MPTEVTLIDKRTAAKSSATGTEMSIGNAPSIIHVGAHRAQLESLSRQGGQLVVRLKTGEVWTVNDFFVADGEVANELVLDDDAGGFWHLDRASALDDPRFAQLSDLDSLLLAESESSGSWLAALGVGALMLGGAAAAGGGGGGGGGSSSSQGPAVSAQTDDAGTAVSGTTTPGASVVIRDQLGNVLAQGTADGGGNFNLPLPTPLQPNQQVQVTATDGAGNSGSVDLTYVDRLAPAAIDVSAVAAVDDVGAVQGALEPGDTTDDARPTFSGTGTPGDTITLYDGDIAVGTAVVDATGHWSLTPDTPLADGTHQLSFTATDPSGNESPRSGVFELTVDTIAPAAPTVNATDGTVIGGTAEPGATVNIDLDGNGTPDTSVPADGNGAWTYTPQPSLPPGTPVGVTATDAAGNTSPATTVTVAGTDDTAPGTPVITGVDDDVAAIIGNITNGGLSNDRQPTISGTAEVGSTVAVSDNGSPLGSTTADATGHWSFTPTGNLASGSHSFSAVATDPRGNVSGTSAPYTVQLDLTAPPMPSVNPSNGTGLSGTAEPGTTVSLDLDGNGTPDASVLADAGTGAWSYTPVPALGDGTVVRVTATDSAGNSSAPATVTVDTVAPNAPVILGLNDDVPASVGNVLSGGLSNDSRPTLTGTAEAGSRIDVFDNGSGSPIGSTTADVMGNWSFTPTVGLGGGAHSFTVTATDAAGNVSAPSPAYALMLDLSAPAAPTVNATDGTVISGMAEPGATVNLDLDGDGAPETSVPAHAGTGVWTYTPAALLPPGTPVGVTATDAAGNTSPATTVTVAGTDDTAPGTPVITGVDDDVAAIIGNITNGGRSNDRQPTINGTAEVGSTVAVSDNGSLLGSTTADATGHWSFTPTGNLPSGSHIFRAVATDEAGNVSGTSDPYTVNLDLTPPATAVIASVSDNVAATVGVIGNGGTSNDSQPTLAGTADLDSTVTVYDNGSAIGTAVVDGDGDWSFTPAGILGSGTHSFTAVAIDVAGNAATPSAAYAVTLDLSAPAAPVIVSVSDDVAATVGVIANGALSNDPLPVLAGTAEAGSTVTVFDNGNPIGTAVVNGSGNWSFTPGGFLGSGVHSFTAVATDAAGNASVASSAYAVTLDLSAPAAPVIVSVSDDVAATVGVVANGASSNDPRPTLAGTAEAGSTVTVLDNGNPIGTTLANAAGNWSFTPAGNLGSGVHSFTAVATDAAGNGSVASGAYAVTLDFSAPSATSSITAISTDTGLASDFITSDTSLTVSGTVSGLGAGEQVQVSVDGVTWSNVTVTSGAWSYVDGRALAAGSYTYHSRVVDAAGNVGGTDTQVVTVDTSAPAATVSITGFSDNTGAPDDWTTHDTSPTFSGTLSVALQTDERVEVSVDGGATWTRATVDNVNNTWFCGAGDLSVDPHTVSVRVVDAAGNVGSTDSETITIVDDNRAPIVQARDVDLLGLVSAEALELIDISGQSLVAFDPDSNLQRVVVQYAPLLSAGLGANTLTASAALAAELGLRIVIDNDPGFLGVVAPSSELTITALNGGTIDNLAINELLRTVHFQQSGLSLSVLSATTITATDNLGASATTAVGTLVNASLLSTSGDSTVREGTSGADILNGTGVNEHLYGYAGNDTLSGAGGNDLLRGGAGADTLNGDEGNDVLVYDSADTVINGGAGVDTLLLDSGTGLLLTLDGATQVRNIERIDLGAGDAGRDIVLTANGLALATDSGDQLVVTGDANDSVTMTGATFQGQVLIDNHAYDQYLLGTVTVRVEDPIPVVV